MNINEILKVTGGVLLCGSKRGKVNSFVRDTRDVKKGSLFFGIKGDFYDGNSFYEEAFKLGAKAVIVDNKDINYKKSHDRVIILVDNVISSMQKLASYKRSKYNIPVIAITGSVGKTSVKDMIYQVVSKKYNTLATPLNLNNHIGVPLTILGLDQHDALVVEMGMNNFGELHVLSNIAKPTMAVITNIGTAHIGNLGSRENILKAKLEILDGMNQGCLFINNDNDMLQTVNYDNLITIGINNNSDYMASNINLGAFSSEFYINDKFVKLNVGTEAFIYNALFAYAVGKKLGIDDEDIIMAIKEFKLSPHRLELSSNKGINIIDDTYNASYDSVKNSLDSLSKVDSRKVFIFGDILELDSFAEKIHKDIGYLCMDDKIDLVLLVGDNTKYTNDVINEDKVKCYHFNSNDDLINNLDKLLVTGDTVLIKGSHGMNLVEVVNYLKSK